MKTIVIAIAGILFPVPVLSQAELRVSATTTFGRHSDCSSGRGICSFNFAPKESDNGTEYFSARRIDEKTLTITMPNNQLTKEDQLRIAGKPFEEIKENEKAEFVQSEKVFIAKETLDALGLNANANLVPAGSYPMTIGKETTEITLTLEMTE